MNDFETLDKETKKIITDVGLSHKIDDKAEELSHGQQRMLEMAITLGAKPDLLLLDEPTQGLAPEATVEMTELIQKLQKIYDLLIEHKMHIVMEISKIITVLNFGEKIEEGTPNKLKIVKKSRCLLRKKIMHLEIKNLHTYYGLVHMLKGVSLNVNEGEIISILGRNGAGKTTQLKVLWVLLLQVMEV